ncbi:Sec-independent protein translocase subunit TatA [Spirillospora sp. CA-255316]
MPNIGTPELIIILVVVLLIFGSAKLPTLARSLGKSARILKAETKGLRDDDDKSDDAKPAPAQAQAPESASARAARLREEAARLEREAAQESGGQRTQGALPSGDPIEGVPVSDYRTRKSS